MLKIMLNDILHLNEEEIKNGKLYLNKYDKDIERYKNDPRDPVDKDVGFSYWSYKGKNHNVYVGSYVIGLMSLGNNNWLFITAGRVIDLPAVENNAPATYERDKRFDALYGRLIVRHVRGRVQNYVLNLRNKIEELEVYEILPKYYEPIKFEGFKKVHLDFKTLTLISDSERFQDYKTILKSVKGVYCLTDNKTGKLYIGSAYGENGVAQRWQCYLDNNTGGNKELKKLYNEKGSDYFSNNFSFTLLEYFPINTTTSEIIERENYWKIAFNTRKMGYNDN